MTKGYGLDCPVARTLDAIGERWTLLILRDLFVFGPRRFRDLERSLARPDHGIGEIEVNEGEKTRVNGRNGERGHGRCSSRYVWSVVRPS